MLKDTNSAVVRLRELRGVSQAESGPVRERFNAMAGLDSSPTGADRVQLLRSAGRELGRLLGAV